jgi:hypothetical protein
VCPCGFARTATSAACSSSRSSREPNSVCRSRKIPHDGCSLAHPAARGPPRCKGGTTMAEIPRRLRSASSESLICGIELGRLPPLPSKPPGRLRCLRPNRGHTQPCQGSTPIAPRPCQRFSPIRFYLTGAPPNSGANACDLLRRAAKAKTLFITCSPGVVRFTSSGFADRCIPLVRGRWRSSGVGTPA